MAGHIQDRWFKVEQGANGKARRVRTDRYGTGMRYRARYVGPDGTEKSLRTYTHLMPSSESRTRKAVDDVYQARGEAPDGPQAAQAA